MPFTYFDTYYSVTESRAAMGQNGSALEYHVNFGVGSRWVTLVVGRIKKTGPTRTTLNAPVEALSQL